MAGSTKIIKENEVLFKLGDPAECMYIVRKGSLKVYFTKGTEEVQLALLKDGAIVGEMAFFDNKPRSASVRALAATEVTEITKADFDKLLQQVPKWMVTMMQSLVTRLRQTNERLAALEATQASSGGGTDGKPAQGPLLLPHQKHPFQHVLRALKLLIMALAKDGQKEGSNYSLPLEAPQKLWADFSGEDAEMLDKIIAVTEQTKFIQKKLDPQKRPILIFINRGNFIHFIEFFGLLSRGFTPLKPWMSADAIALFTTMVETAVSSGYETLNVSFTSVKSQAAAKGVDVAGWAAAMGELTLIPDLKLTKAGNDVTARIIVKDHKTILGYLKFIQLYADAKLT